MKNILKRNIDKGKALRILLKLKNEKVKFFLCNRGIGDTLIFLSLLDSYYKTYPTNEKVNIVIQKNHVALLNEYKNYINDFYIVESNIMEGLMHFAFAGKLPENVKFILPRGASEFLGYKNLSIWDLQYLNLGISEKSEPLVPVFNDSVYLLNELKEKKKIVKNKTVIISPDATSVDLVSKDIWKEIILFCKSQNMTIILNSRQRSSISGITTVFCEVDELYKIVEYAGYYIGLRSGLCDLIAFTNSKMLVIYPSCSENNVKKMYTFSNIPLKNHIVEKYDYEVIAYLDEGDFFNEI